ncbi:MAG TPA: hypothetical protein VHT24_12385, partial [Pseudacidobacterium sp.]|nr:hypothetical protein [Pseudacidobacterium sp.]
ALPPNAWRAAELAVEGDVTAREVAPVAAVVGGRTGKGLARELPSEGRARQTKDEEEGREN